MTPLRIEAVYERIPQGVQAPAVRWGFRASLDRESKTPDAAPVSASAPDPRPLGQLPVRADRTPVRALRHAPREAEEQDRDPQPFPDVMAYSPFGWAIPLMPQGMDVAGRGQNLDLLA